VRLRQIITHGKIREHGTGAGWATLEEVVAWAD
jgi:hypothetical protein